MSMRNWAVTSDFLVRKTDPTRVPFFSAIQLRAKAGSKSSTKSPAIRATSASNSTFHSWDA